LDNAINETEFKIERKTVVGGYTQIATKKTNVSSFSAVGLTAANEYYYRAQASNSVGDSANSS